MQPYRTRRNGRIADLSLSRRWAGFVSSNGKLPPDGEVLLVHWPFIDDVRPREREKKKKKEKNPPELDAMTDRGAVIDLTVASAWLPVSQAT